MCIAVYFLRGGSVEADTNLDTSRASGTVTTPQMYLLPHLHCHNYCHHYHYNYHHYLLLLIHLHNKNSIGGDSIGGDSTEKEYAITQLRSTARNHRPPIKDNGTVPKYRSHLTNNRRYHQTRRGTAAVTGHKTAAAQRTTCWPKVGINGLYFCTHTIRYICFCFLF